MHGARGVKKIGAGAGRVQGAGDFKAYVGGFTCAGDGNAARAIGANSHENIDGLEKGNRKPGMRD